MTDVGQSKAPSRGITSNKQVRIALAGLIGTLALLANPLDSIANQNLTVHMFQHIGLFVFSAVFGYGLERILVTRLASIKRITHLGWAAYIYLIKFNTRTRGLIFAALVPAIVFSFWHFPPNFDLTATNAYAHIAEHFSYIVGGSLVGAAVLAVPRQFRAGLLVLGFMQAGMMGSMMLVWPQFYSAYSAAQNTQMDSALMLFGAAGMICTGSWFLKALDVI
jgi:cytochrome c oxidase assembly factor CtaG